MSTDDKLLTSINEPHAPAELSPEPRSINEPDGYTPPPEPFSEPKPEQAEPEQAEPEGEDPDELDEEIEDAIEAGDLVRHRGKPTTTRSSKRSKAKQK